MIRDHFCLGMGWTLWTLVNNMSGKYPPLGPTLQKLVDYIIFETERLGVAFDFCSGCQVSKNNAKAF